jgi:hypothetical protein
LVAEELQDHSMEEAEEPEGSEKLLEQQQEAIQLHQRLEVYVLQL